MGIRNKHKRIQIQIKDEETSKALTIYDQGNVQEIYEQIYFLYERLSQSNGETTLTFK